MIWNNFIISSEKIKDIKLNSSEIEKYNTKLFNSIESDYYNMSLIYKKDYKSIKIKHKSMENKSNKIVCVFGIYVTDYGLQIADSMLNWLLPEYDVYCVYQLYPGELYEYPALRFAQWFSLNYNISIIFYLHTKGSANRIYYNAKVRTFWKIEFRKPNNNIYIKLLKDNITDISVPYRYNACTWFNGMFISNRAFIMVNEIPLAKWRFHYECFLFKVKENNNSYNIRIKGIINDSIQPAPMIKQIIYVVDKYEHYEFLKNRNKKIFNKIINIATKILIIIIFCKIGYKYKFFKKHFKFKL